MLVALLVASVWLGTGCASLAQTLQITPSDHSSQGAASDSPTRTRRVTILYTGYGRGIADPVAFGGPVNEACGCTNTQQSPSGGLVRRATYLKAARSEEPGALLVDTGDALGGVVEGSPNTADPQTDALIARALTAMGYDALNVGSGERRAGPNALHYLAQPSAPTLIASNLATKAWPAPATKPYVIREVGGLRVGIVGVTSPDKTGKASDVALAPPVEALRPLLTDLRRKADVIVALADLEPAEVRDLAAAGLDLQVVLGGRDLQSEPLTRVGQTVVVAVGGEGRYVGRLTLQVDARGQVVSAENGFVVLDTSVADDPDLLALRAQYR